MDKNSLLSDDDLKSIFDQLEDTPEEETQDTMTPEEAASQRRYEEIIKKHKTDNN